ncbi:MAG: GNAT family N-acetyltransferase [Candidatus Methanofastidiosia archaeon]
MTYIIKSYQEKFLQEQEQVGKEATKNWSSFNQTPAEQLKQAYSQPDFDPETRHYCFKDGKLVGFLTSKISESNKVKKADLEFPLVLPGYEEAEPLLYEKAINTLKDKGVTVVRSRASELWGKTVKMAKQWGYIPTEELGVVYSADIGTVKIMGMPELESIEDYNHQKDFKQMVDIFVKEFNMTPEQAHANFEALENAGDQVVCHIVIRKGGEIIGRALVLQDENDPHQAYTGAIYVTNESQRKLLLTKILTICKKKSIETLHIPIYGDLLSKKDQLADLFESLGFSHTGTISYYEKEI